MISLIVCNFLSVEGARYCPAKWDTLLCWPPTLAGTTASQNCPRNYYGYDSRRFAYRVCWPNGTWYIHPQSQKDWSNYTTCVDREDLEVTTNVYIVQARTPINLKIYSVLQSTIGFSV